MKIFKYSLLTLILFLFILNIDIVIKSVIDSSNIFITKVFVSIFPFIILSDILIYYDYHIFLANTIGKFFSKLFNIDSNTTIIFILSMLTSHPTNAIFIKDMLDNNQIDIKTANKILPYTYFPSISFVIGTIGLNMFKSIKIGLLLWLIVLINNIIIGLFLRKEKININNNYLKQKETNIFLVIKNSILKGINTSFIILGNLIIFTIIFNILTKYINFNPIILSIISSILELTNGINQISMLNTSTNIKIILTIFSLSFSSLSILFQSFSILSNYKINIKRILIIKLVFSYYLIVLYFLWTRS